MAAVGSWREKSRFLVSLGMAGLWERQSAGKRNDRREKVLESAAAAAPETAAGEASTAAEATAASSEA
jgi:hypothetical protein